MRLRCALATLLLSLVAVSLHGDTLSERAPRLTGSINEAALQRFKTTTAPLISADGTVAGRSLSPERFAYRYPILRFAEDTRRSFAETVFPIGVREYPLSIEIGTETEPLTTLDRRIFRVPGDFSQLVIRIHNPDTVSLDTLRTAIVEAQLREELRAQTGNYAGLKLPTWFVEALVDASRDNLWRAEAYEIAHKRYKDGTLPTLDEFFLPDATPPKEVAACFATWVLERNAANRKALLTAEWKPETILGLVTDQTWLNWFERQEGRVFMPGLLTRSQYERWKKGLLAPTSTEMAVELTETLTRDALGRPQPFRDLTFLYLKAYGAFATADVEGYKTLRAQADEARVFLDKHFETNPLLYDASDVPAEGVFLSPTPTGDVQ